MRTISALIFSLAMLLPGEGAKAQTTAGEMMQACTKLESFWQRYPPTRQQTFIPNDADGATCYGFILAVSHLAQAVHYRATDDCSKGLGPNCRLALGICFPKNVSLSQILGVFLAHARSHSAEWHQDAGSQFLLAMLIAFGCKETKELPRSNE